MLILLYKQGVELVDGKSWMKIYLLLKSYPLNHAVVHARYTTEKKWLWISVDLFSFSLANNLFLYPFMFSEGTYNSAF